ncbi:hypothetical protein A2115_00210 [Candidatus Woesebacteria bacterium GWA1_41_8]|uniref:Uncharacterized protein n=1 Tax=Candidatus Woesebacteria bacterium GWA1_41_8 TaxID=1802471 RepID=A0A1F7WGA6_9BACT|nr:MAG: hypothetical protein A2115_00210 [Candidatus Woesebacteria bacterium GWA1_41_8]
MASEIYRFSGPTDEYGFKVTGQIPRDIYLLDPSGVDTNLYTLVSEFPRILKDIRGNLCDRYGFRVQGETLLQWQQWVTR